MSGNSTLHSTPFHSTAICYFIDSSRLNISVLGTQKYPIINMTVPYQNIKTNEDPNRKNKKEYLNFHTLKYQEVLFAQNE